MLPAVLKFQPVKPGEVGRRGCALLRIDHGGRPARPCWCRATLRRIDGDERCMYYACMGVALQIRDVPEDLRDVLAEQAAQRGQSMQAYLLDVIRREARLARNVQMFERTSAHRVSIPDDLAPERIVREGREAGFETDREDDLA